jgi:hypothetical protein
MLTSAPQQIRAQGTDGRFLHARKRELKGYASMPPRTLGLVRRAPLAWPALPSVARAADSSRRHHLKQPPWPGWEPTPRPTP